MERWVQKWEVDGILPVLIFIHPLIYQAPTGCQGRARVQIVHERNLVYDFPKLTAIRAHTDLQYREMRV